MKLKSALTKLTACAAFTGALLTTTVVQAGLYDIPSEVKISTDEYEQRSRSMLSPSDWKHFETGKEQNLNYSYFYNEDRQAFAAVMEFDSEATNLENMLIGTLYRAEKEKWSIVSHGAVEVDDHMAYKLVYTMNGDPTKKDRLLTTYLIDNDEHPLNMVVFDVPQRTDFEGVSKYDEQAANLFEFDELVEKFDY